MYSYCLISAWGKTTATIGTNEDTDCLTKQVIEDETVKETGGNYHYKATCMMMEI